MSAVSALEMAKKYINQLDNWRGAGNLAAVDRDEIIARAYIKTCEAVEDAEHALQSIDQWCKAYPETMFRPISKEKMEEANAALSAIGVDMGAMHASWARHLIGGIGELAAAALSCSAPKPEK